MMKYLILAGTMIVAGPAFAQDVPATTTTPQQTQPTPGVPGAPAQETQNDATAPDTTGEAVDDSAGAPTPEETTPTLPPEKPAPGQPTNPGRPGNNPPNPAAPTNPQG